MAGKDEMTSIEKVHYMKVARGEGSESTRTHDLQNNEETHKLSISIQKSSRDEKFERLTESYEKGIKEPPMAKIQTVPLSLRGHKHFKKYFEPRGVALGPIHHRKSDLEFAENYKQRLAEFFILDSGCNKFDTYNKIEKDIEKLRACYDDEVTKCYDDKELAWMLFVDGSSLLAFIKCTVDPCGKLMKHMKIKNDLAAFALQDTFLLENQLPFSLLKLLIDQSTKVDGETWIKNIHAFIDGVQSYHSTELLGDKETQSSNDSQPSDHSSSSKTTRSPKSKLGSKPNDDVRLNFPDDSKCCKPDAMIHAQSDDTPITFRNIMELKSAGIRVRPNKKGSCLEEMISFRKVKRIFPTLFLPPIVVDDWTAPKFLNLVAYEMCPGFFNNFGITSYVSFLDSLIDQPEDVKYLRHKEILYNKLGSDVEVANLFNEISTDLVWDDQAYFDSKQATQKHYNKVWTKWVALGYNKHFSNPWTLFALIGALVALALSFIQTWKALEDSCTKICRP